MEQGNSKAIDKLIADRVAIRLNNNKIETSLDANSMVYKEITEVLNIAIKEILEEREKELKEKFKEKQKELEIKETKLQRKEIELREKEDKLQQVNTNIKKISENVEIGTFIETNRDGMKEFTLRVGKIMPCTEEEMRIYGVIMKLQGRENETFRIFEVHLFEGGVFYQISTNYCLQQQYFKDLDTAKKYLIEEAKKQKLL